MVFKKNRKFILSVFVFIRDSEPDECSIIRGYQLFLMKC